MLRLDAKVALGGGAARGIGLAIAQAFHRKGAVVILSGIRDEPGRAAADELGHRAA